MAATTTLASNLDVEQLTQHVMGSDGSAEVRKRCEELLRLYECDRHFDVVEKLQELQTVLAGSDSALQFLEKCTLSRVARTKAQECRTLLNDVLDHSTWSPTSVDSKTGHGTYYRAEEGKASHSFKVVGKVNASMLDIASVLMELDLYTEWFPMCIEAHDQGSISRFHRSSKFAVRLLWPVANREVFLIGYALDDLTANKRVIINARSVAADEPVPDGITRPELTSGNARADLYVGGFVIDVLTPTTCVVSFIMNVDPHLANIPQPLINWVSGKIIWVLLYQMEKAAKECAKATGKYAERRRATPEVYDYFVARANEVFNVGESV